MIKPNPFTPKSGLEPKIFINREEEIAFFHKRLDEACKGYTNHYIINGEWGSGKTSLLRYFKLLAQERKYAVSYFLAKEFAAESTDLEITLHIIQSIIRNLPYKFSERKSRFFQMIKGIGIQILGTGFNVSFDMDKTKYIDSQIFLTDSLLLIWEDMKKQTELMIVLIDDVQNYSGVRRIFTSLKNVLSDERLIKNTRILFLLSSTIAGWKPFMGGKHPIGRFFIPRTELENFNRKETFFLLESLLKDTGVNFSGSVKERIYKYTDGHLFQIHSLGSALYDNHKDGKVTLREWEKGFNEGLLYLGNTVYDGIIQNLSDREIDVMAEVDHFQPFTSSEMNKLKINGLNVYLKRLTDKGILRNIKRGVYQVRDKLFCEYLKEIVK